MHAPKEPDDRILELAALQAGVISHDQIKQIGFPPGSIKRWRKGWVRLVTGIHCIHEPTWESWCWAGVLHAGDGVVGGMAAAYLHGFVTKPPAQITVWHQHKGPIGRLGDSTAGVTFRRAVRSGSGDPARTGVEQTLVDIAAEANEDEIVSAMARAFVRKRTLTASSVRAVMSRRGRMRHRALYEELLGQLKGRIESVLEWRFLQVVLRGHSLPEPEFQAALAPGTRSDGAWRQYGVVVELDGRLGHEQAFRDMARDNRLAATGLVTLRYGWHDVTNRPCEVAWQIFSVLRSKGFEGGRRRCGRCRQAGIA